MASTINQSMAEGKAAREASPGLQKLVTRFKVELGLTNNSSLIAIVWMSISNSREKLVGQTPLNIFIILVAGVSLTLMHP